MRQSRPNQVKQYRGSSGGRSGAAGYLFQDEYTALQLAEMLVPSSDRLAEVMWEKRAVFSEASAGVISGGSSDLILRFESGRLTFVQSKTKPPSALRWSCSAFERSGVVQEFWTLWRQLPEQERPRARMRLATRADCDDLERLLSSARRCRHHKEIEREVAPSVYQQIQYLAGALRTKISGEFLLFLSAIETHRVENPIERALTLIANQFEDPERAVREILHVVQQSKKAGPTAKAHHTQPTLVEHLHTCGIVSRSRIDAPELDITVSQGQLVVRSLPAKVAGPLDTNLAWSQHLLRADVTVDIAANLNVISSTAAELLKLVQQFQDPEPQTSLTVVLGRPTTNPEKWSLPGVYRGPEVQRDQELLATFDRSEEEVLFVWLFFLAFSKARDFELDRCLQRIAHLPGIAELREAHWPEQLTPTQVDEHQASNYPVHVPRLGSELIRILLATHAHTGDPLEPARVALSREDFATLSIHVARLSQRELSPPERAEFALLKAALAVAENEIKLAVDTVAAVNPTHWTEQMRLSAALILGSLGEIDHARRLLEQSAGKDPITSSIELYQRVVRLSIDAVDFESVSSGRGKWYRSVETLVSEEVARADDRPLVRASLARLCLQTGNFGFARPLLFTERYASEDTSSILHMKALVCLQEFLASQVDDPDHDTQSVTLNLLREGIDFLKASLTLANVSGTRHQRAVLQYNLGLALLLDASRAAGEDRTYGSRVAAEIFQNSVANSCSERLRSQAASLAGQAWLLGGRPSEALGVLRAVPEDDLDPAARSNLASALLLLGQTRESLDVLSSLLAKDQLPPWQAIVNTALVLLVAGRPEWAVRALQSARPHAGKSSWSVDHLLGRAYLALRDYRAAERSLRIALESRSFDGRLYRTHYEAFRGGSAAALSGLISHLRDIFAMTHEDPAPLTALEIALAQALDAYTEVIAESFPSQPRSLLSNTFRRILDQVDRVVALLDGLSNRLSTQERWTPHAVVEHVREVMLPQAADYHKVSAQRPFTPNALSVQTNWSDISKSAESLGSRFDIPVRWEPLETTVLSNVLRGNSTELDSAGHWLHLAARQLETDQNAPLLCYGSVANLTHKGYQRRVVQRALYQMHGRAILADEVGLGKTIEAGLILTEYRLRYLARRCLVLVPSLALAHQWHSEFLHKFPILSQHPDSVAVYRSHSWRDWNGHDICIATYQAASSQRDKVITTQWDMVIADEAHHLHSRSSRAFKLVNQIDSRYLLLLTATPSQREDRSDLFTLTALVRPTLFRTFSQFAVEFRKGVLTDVQGQRLQALLSQVMVRNSITGVISEVRTGRREFRNPSLPLTAPELNFYSEVITFVLARAKQRDRLPLSYYVLAREASSSVSAALATIRTMVSNTVTGDLEDLKMLQRLAAAVTVHTKIEYLQHIVEEVVPRKVLVFVEFRRSAVAVSNELGAAVLQGGMTTKERHTVMSDFVGDPAKRVIVVTPGMYEGLNFQVCSVLVNFDLPWNPVKIEQRIGRIQRIGQQQETLDIISLAAEGTIEQDIRDGLVRKVRIFEQMFGTTDLLLTGDNAWRGLQSRLQAVLKTAADHNRLREGIKELFENEVSPLVAQAEARRFEMLAEFFGFGRGPVRART